MERWPSEDDRTFVRELNALASEHSCAGFGEPGMLSGIKARRQLTFAKAARKRWPELGQLRTVEVAQWNASKVDHKCDFWRAGQRRYMEALGRYAHALYSGQWDREKCELLEDLGFRLVEDFVSEKEEEELLGYWSPDGPVYQLGTEEKHSRRRFFNYGPILPRATHGTTKSTLNVIPSLFGAMPPVVEEQRLRDRIRSHSPADPDAEEDFDQMYVNYYDSSINSYIDFHHDHMSCMMGTVAGVSLGSACTLLLRPLEYRNSEDAFCIPLPERSLFFLTGLSRWHLQHAIMDMRHDRLSLTFRTVDRSASRDHLWSRSWARLKAVEASNALWPLVTPDGWELHLLKRWSWCAPKGSGGYSYYRPKESHSHWEEVGAELGTTKVEDHRRAHRPSQLEDLGHFFQGRAAGRSGRGRGRSFYRAETLKWQPRQQRVQQLFECAETLRMAEKT